MKQKQQTNFQFNKNGIITFSIRIDVLIFTSNEDLSGWCVTFRTR